MKVRANKGEKIGGGFFVHRRDRRSSRIKPSTLPFEHATLMKAINECERLAALNPGAHYVVVAQCYDAFVDPVAPEVEDAL